MVEYEVLTGVCGRKLQLVRGNLPFATQLLALLIRHLIAIVQAKPLLALPLQLASPVLAIGSTHVQQLFSHFAVFQTEYEMFAESGMIFYVEL